MLPEFGAETQALLHAWDGGQPQAEHLEAVQSKLSEISRRRVELEQQKLLGHQDSIGYEDQGLDSASFQSKNRMPDFGDSRDCRAFRAVLTGTHLEEKEYVMSPEFLLSMPSGFLFLAC
jgi:hypothetical protein